jgi:hypothetical protein
MTDEKFDFENLKLRTPSGPEALPGRRPNSELKTINAARRNKK